MMCSVRSETFYPKIIFHPLHFPETLHILLLIIICISNLICFASVFLFLLFVIPKFQFIIYRYVYILPLVGQMKR